MADVVVSSVPLLNRATLIWQICDIDVHVPDMVHILHDAPASPLATSVVDQNPCYNQQQASNHRDYNNQSKNHSVTCVI
jgi:hypothetical protein